MTNEEYEVALAAIEAEKKQKTNLLIRTFVRENAQYAIGDIISQESRGIIRINSIKPYRFGDKIPEIVYGGTALTKALVPKKNGSIKNVYSSDDNIVLLKKAEPNG
jgi:hypothetical protein